MRKNYNPFKMWGSYLGALIIPIITLLDSGFCALTFSCNVHVMMFNFGKLTSVVLYGGLIIGFFVGWGIHSLVRKMRK